MRATYKNKSCPTLLSGFFLFFFPLSSFSEKESKKPKAPVLLGKDNVLLIKGLSCWTFLFLTIRRNAARTQHGSELNDASGMRGVSSGGLSQKLHNRSPLSPHCPIPARKEPGNFQLGWTTVSIFLCQPAEPLEVEPNT